MYVAFYFGLHVHLHVHVHVAFYFGQHVAYKIKVTTNVASNMLPSVWGPLSCPYVLPIVLYTSQLKGCTCFWQHNEACLCLSNWSGMAEICYTPVFMGLFSLGNMPWKSQPWCITYTYTLTIIIDTGSVQLQDSSSVTQVTTNTDATAQG